jgi:hypothetical protein
VREPVGSRGLGSLTAGGGPGVGWQAAEVGWGGRQWPLSDGMEPWPGLHSAAHSTVNSESCDNLHDCEFRVAIYSSQRIHNNFFGREKTEALFLNER